MLSAQQQIWRTHQECKKNKVHLKEEHQNDPDSNTSQHFSQPNHLTANMSLLGILYTPQDKIERKTLEKKNNSQFKSFESWWTK